MFSKFDFSDIVVTAFNSTLSVYNTAGSKALLRKVKYSMSTSMSPQVKTTSLFTQNIII